MVNFYHISLTFVKDNQISPYNFLGYKGEDEQSALTLVLSHPLVSDLLSKDWKLETPKVEIHPSTMCPHNAHQLTTYLWDDEYDINGLYLNFKCLPDDPKVKLKFMENLKTLLSDFDAYPDKIVL